MSGVTSGSASRVSVLERDAKTKRVLDLELKYNNRLTALLSTKKFDSVLVSERYAVRRHIDGALKVVCTGLPGPEIRQGWGIEDPVKFVVRSYNPKTSRRLRSVRSVLDWVGGHKSTYAAKPHSYDQPAAKAQGAEFGISEAGTFVSQEEAPLAKADAAPKRKPKTNRTPIIIVPSGLKETITLYNVQGYLENGSVVPTAVAAKANTTGRPQHGEEV